MLNNKTIICDSNIKWSFNKYSKHHLMELFAEKNQVYFIDPQVDILKYLFSGKPLFNRIHEANKLNIYSSLSLPLREKSGIVRGFDQQFFLSQIKPFFNKPNRNDVVFFMGNPMKGYIYDSFKASAFFVYHCSDNLSALFDEELRGLVLKREEELLKKVDMVLAVSPLLYEKCLKFNKNSFLVENGVADEFFVESNQVPKDLAKIKHPIIGYVGCIDKKIDYNLLDFITDRIQDKSFVFVGPVHPQNEKEFEKICKKSNVRYLGEKRWEQLPAYIHNFDVCLIPWAINDFTKFTSPLKLREYLASGKPVVSTSIPIPERFLPGVYIAKDPQEYSNLIDDVLKQKADPKAVTSLVRNETWRKKAEEISDLIEKCQKN